MAKVYMRLSEDRYRLPVAVADTVAELARLTGYSTDVVRSGLTKARKGRNGCWATVEIEDD